MIRPFGRELSFSPELGQLERYYIKLFGAPILGLRVRARTVLPLLDKMTSQPLRIVDIGSGRGMITLACARRFPEAEVIGIDLDEKQNARNNEIVRKLGVGNIVFKTFDAMNLPALGTFDLVISTDMLEHLEDDRAGLRLFYNALVSGGALLLHVPHITRKTFWYRRSNWMDIAGHVRPGYSKNGLNELLTSGGFIVKECRYNYNSFETLANDISKMITGAKERNRGMYALAFPLLMVLIWIGGLYRPKQDGSGLVVLATKR